MYNTENIIKKIKRALMACADPIGDDSYKLGYCQATLRNILQDLEQEEQPEQQSDPWGVLGALDEATKIR